MSHGESLRRIRPTWQIPLALTFVSILFAISAGCIVSGLKLRNLLQRLASDGAQTLGTVVNTEKLPGRLVDSLNISYAFTVNARRYSGTHVVHSSLLQQRFQRGKQIAIPCSTTDPNKNLPLARTELGNRQIRALILVGIPAGVLFGVMASYTSVIVIRLLREDWHFARHGRLTTVRVIAREGFVRRRCQYRFVIEHPNVEHEVKLRNKWFNPTPGQKLPALYFGDPPLESKLVGDLINFRIADAGSRQ